jgi:hypothetical protein
MAIRYSGDVEVRLGYERGAYRGTVRDPEFHWRGEIRPKRALRDPRSSESYDRAAKAMIEKAEREERRRSRAARERGEIRIIRVFQAPCPV